MGETDPQAIVDSYTESSEITRVDRSSDAAIMFQIERWFIERYLPESGTVVDIGGGPGRFAVEIARLGRDVVLTDLTPKHIEQARQLAEQEGVADKIRRVPADGHPRSLCLWRRRVPYGRLLRHAQLYAGSRRARPL